MVTQHFSVVGGKEDQGIFRARQGHENTVNLVIDVVDAAVVSGLKLVLLGGFEEDAPRVAVVQALGLVVDAGPFPDWAVRKLHAVIAIVIKGGGVQGWCGCR